MVEPLIDVEKEEDYEICIHLNTFTLDRDNTGNINPLGIALPAQQQPQEQIYQYDESTQSNILFPKYALTKKNICWVVDELFKAW